MNKNPLLRTDVYKISHMLQYKPGTTKAWSYLMSRSTKNYTDTLFFGLQYYLQEYLCQPITRSHAEEFFARYEEIIGQPVTAEARVRVLDLADLGYWPVEIRAVPEGSVIPNRNLLMSITNTHDNFHWCVGFIESLLLKVWYPCTVATCSMAYRELLEKFFRWTVDPNDDYMLPFMVHDFGYRGDSSEEGAELSGAAHLINFTGSDTIVAGELIRNVYGAHAGEELRTLMQSVPASEHSVMCSFGRSGELDAFRHMLRTYPAGIVSIVSDTFNVYTVLTDFCTVLFDDIMKRNGKTVFRPDSGDPELVICGDPAAPPNSPQRKGCLRLLDEKFGSTKNNLGFKVLNPHVGLIYGDGMYLARYERILTRMSEMGYAASNLIIGVGGILRYHTRDTLGHAIKATYIECDGQAQEIEKDPITDPGKKSHKGLMRLDFVGNEWSTADQCTLQQASQGMLQRVFADGVLYNRQSFNEVRDRAAQGRLAKRTRWLQQ